MLVDLANPDVQQFILQGGGLLVALFLFVRLLTSFIQAQSSKDKDDNTLFRLLLDDIKQAINRGTEAQERNNEVIAELKDYIRASNARTEQSMLLFDKRLGRVEESVVRVEDKVDGVVQQLGTNPKPGEK